MIKKKVGASHKDNIVRTIIYVLGLDVTSLSKIQLRYTFSIPDIKPSILYVFIVDNMVAIFVSRQWSISLIEDLYLG